jgi:hypothetical protein
MGLQRRILGRTSAFWCQDPKASRKMLQGSAGGIPVWRCSVVSRNYTLDPTTHGALQPMPMWSFIITLWALTSSCLYWRNYHPIGAEYIWLRGLDVICRIRDPFVKMTFVSDSFFFDNHVIKHNNDYLCRHLFTTPPHQLICEAKEVCKLFGSR